MNIAIFQFLGLFLSLLSWCSGDDLDIYYFFLMIPFTIPEMPVCRVTFIMDCIINVVVAFFVKASAFLFPTVPEYSGTQYKSAWISLKLDIVAVV